MNMVQIAARLEKRYGLGTNPPARRRLYERIERAIEEYGETAYKIVATAVADSAAAAKQDRWFCRTVTCRLKAHGCWPESGEIVDF